MGVAAGIGGTGATASNTNNPLTAGGNGGDDLDNMQV